jgi:quercetin dioxygenase-like cupin family protein
MSEAVAGLEAGPAERAVMLGPGDGTQVWFLKNLMTIKAVAQNTNGAYGLLESLIAPGFSPPLHVHHREDEAFWVLDGEFTFRCGQRTFRGLPGSYVFLPRGVPHTFVVEGDKPGRLLTLISPGGGEAFFVEAGRPAERPTLPPPGPIDFAALERAATRFGDEFVGPPLAPSPIGA